MWGGNIKRFLGSCKLEQYEWYIIEYIVYVFECLAVVVAVSLGAVCAENETGWTFTQHYGSTPLLYFHNGWYRIPLCINI